MSAPPKVSLWARMSAAIGLSPKQKPAGPKTAPREKVTLVSSVSRNLGPAKKDLTKMDASSITTVAEFPLNVSDSLAAGGKPDRKVFRAGASESVSTKEAVLSNQSAAPGIVQSADQNSVSISACVLSVPIGAPIAAPIPAIPNSDPEVLHVNATGSTGEFLFFENMSVSVIFLMAGHGKFWQVIGCLLSEAGDRKMILLETTVLLQDRLNGEVFVMCSLLWSMIESAGSCG